MFVTKKLHSSQIKATFLIDKSHFRHRKRLHSSQIKATFIIDKRRADILKYVRPAAIWKADERHEKRKEFQISYEKIISS